MLPRHAAQAQPATDPATEEIKALLARATGNVRLSAADSPVVEKVRHRLTQTGLPSTSAYLSLLKGGETGKHELDNLIAELTIGETYFFRHPEQFDALRDHVLPACIERHRNSRHLRIWSVGSANGAEPYSIAIVVQQLLGSQIDDWTVTIVGSDINRAFLAEAEAGIYSKWSLRAMQDATLAPHFARNGPLWAIDEKYKQYVHFVYHNVIHEPTPLIHKNIFAFDIVFCRNVMIYFEERANRELIDRLDAALVDDGWLFVAPTDFTPYLNAAFMAEKQAGAIVYRKRPAAATPLPRAIDDRARLRATVPAYQSRPQTPTKPARSAPPRRDRRARRDASAREPNVPDAAPSGDIATIVALANRGDWASAAHHCETMLAADACNAEANYFHALVLQSTGAHAAAEQALKRAIFLDRGFALAHYQLALARKEAHDIAACVKAFRNTLDALSQTPDAEVVSPCGQITALELRELAAQQLELLGGA